MTTKTASYWIKPDSIPGCITKGALAEMVLPADLTFDFALPQNWLDQFKNDQYQYEVMVGSCVTCYPKGSIFGEIVNLLTGEIVS